MQIYVLSCSRLTNHVSELEASNSQLKIELDSEAKNRKVETEILAKKLADSVKQLETSKQKAIDAINEVSVLKRKNQASLRELQKELKDCQRRLEQNSLRLSPVLSQSSRASSNSSLHRLGNNAGNSSSNLPNGDGDQSSHSGSNLSLSANSDQYVNGSVPLVRTNPQIQVSYLLSDYKRRSQYYIHGVPEGGQKQKKIAWV